MINSLISKQSKILTQFSRNFTNIQNGYSSRYFTSITRSCNISNQMLMNEKKHSFVSKFENFGSRLSSRESILDRSIKRYNHTDTSNTSNQSVSTPTPNPTESNNQIPSEVAAKIEQLKREAEAVPTDLIKQLEYVKELDRYKLYREVINHTNNPNLEKNIDLSIYRMKALVYLGELSPNTMNLPNGAGSSKTNPFYTTNVTIEDNFSKYSRIIYQVLMVIGTFVIIYWIISSSKGGTGGLGELMNTTVNQSLSPTTVFNDVKGCDEAKEELADIVEYLKNPEVFAEMGAKLPKGILLVGPPGCGKTLLAKAMAGEAEVPFYYTSGSEFEEMLVGVGARRVRSLFQKARDTAPCIVFVDEIDAVGSKRDAMDTRSSKMSLNQMLVEMDGFSSSKGIVVIAATNMPDSLDPALTRPGRFDRQVTVDLPDLKARRAILELYLGDKHSNDVDLEQLAKATVGFSGADIFNMVNTSLITAVKKKMTKVTNSMLIHAKETVQMGPERKSLFLTPETKKITAHHEAGHALISLLHNKPIVKATLVPRGHALGMVSMLPKDEMLTKKEDLLHQMDTAMGGRVAEELIFGSDKVTQGAGSDFRQATKIAYTMVASYGMSDKLGHFSFSDREYQSLSPDTKALIDNEVKVLLEQSYERAKKTLTTHKKQLCSIAQALLDYETLTEEEVRMAFDGKDLSSHKATKKTEEDNLIRLVPTTPIFVPATIPGEATVLPGKVNLQ